MAWGRIFAHPDIAPLPVQFYPDGRPFGRNTRPNRQFGKPEGSRGGDRL